MREIGRDVSDERRDPDPPQDSLPHAAVIRQLSGKSSAFQSAPDIRVISVRKDLSRLISWERRFQPREHFEYSIEVRSLGQGGEL
ncbi:MAG: hypothetical protein KDD42_10115, partial [Bdellovibrionales bacterium]|nr:hypothetical protein [Bdellovibrionales bacterium]